MDSTQLVPAAHYEKPLADYWSECRQARLLPDAVKRLIEQTTWRLIRRNPDSSTLRSGVEWRLIFAVQRACDSWDFRRGPYEQWAKGAVKLEALKIAEELARRNRRWQKTVWIDAAADDEDASSAVVDLVSVNGVWRMISAIDLRACYERLNSLERTIFRRIVEGFSRREIANALGFKSSVFYGRIWPHFAHNVRRFYER